MARFQFKRLNPNKLSISFTWDDNFTTHSFYIAPAFIKVNKRCTFYVNPGEANFASIFAQLYADLAKQDFEIGSHGFTHSSFSNISTEEQHSELIKSRDAIKEITHITPVTFAFPHHDFNSSMLENAHKIYLETRNTLDKTVRFSVKSNTTPQNIRDFIKENIEKHQSIVFSGHSISSLPGISSKIEDAGYEPITLENLIQFLNVALTYSEHSEICTFEQAALKMFIINKCKFDERFVIFDDTDIERLSIAGLNLDRIANIL